MVHVGKWLVIHGISCSYQRWMNVNFCLFNQEDTIIIYIYIIIEYTRKGTNSIQITLKLLHVCTSNEGFFP